MVDDALVQVIYSSSGIQNVRGSATVQQQLTNAVKRINRYTTYDTPIEIGYSLRQYKWLYTASTGINIRWYQQNSGYIHPNDGEENNIQEDPLQWYHTSGPRLSTAISAGIGYQLGSASYLITRGRLQYDLQSMTTDRYGIKETLSGFNIEIGLRKHF